MNAKLPDAHGGLQNGGVRAKTNLTIIILIITIKIMVLDVTMYK